MLDCWIAGLLEWCGRCPMTFRDLYPPAPLLLQTHNHRLQEEGETGLSVRGDNASSVNGSLPLRSLAGTLSPNLAFEQSSNPAI